MLARAAAENFLYQGSSVKYRQDAIVPYSTWNIKFRRVRIKGRTTGLNKKWNGQYSKWPNKRWSRRVCIGIPYHHCRWWINLTMSNARWQCVFSMMTPSLCCKQNRDLSENRMSRHSCVQVHHGSHHWRRSCLWCSFKGSRTHCHVAAEVVELFVQSLVLLSTPFLHSGLVIH